MVNRLFKISATVIWTSQNGEPTAVNSDMILLKSQQRLVFSSNYKITQSNLNIDRSKSYH